MSCTEWSNRREFKKPDARRNGFVVSRGPSSVVSHAVFPAKTIATIRIRWPERSEKRAGFPADDFAVLERKWSLPIPRSRLPNRRSTTRSRTIYVVHRVDGGPATVRVYVGHGGIAPDRVRVGIPARLKQYTTHVRVKVVANDGTTTMTNECVRSTNERTECPCTVSSLYLRSVEHVRGAGYSGVRAANESAGDGTRRMRRPNGERTRSGTSAVARELIRRGPATTAWSARRRRASHRSARPTSAGGETKP